MSNLTSGKLEEKFLVNRFTPEEAEAAEDHTQEVSQQ